MHGERIWSQDGFVSIDSVAPREIHVRPHGPANGRAQSDPIVRISLDNERSWRSLLDALT
jgi:hypothetical protein